MQILVLGSGTIRSGLKRNPAGYLLINGADRALLDCGPGILTRLQQSNTDVLDIDTIFISHFHLDHCSDLFPLLLKRCLINTAANAGLILYGPPGLGRWYEKMASLQGSWLNNQPPTVSEMPETGLSWSGWQISSMLNGHTENSISLRLDNNSSVFYSSDMDFNPQIAQLASGADIAIVECSTRDEAKVKGHMTPAETGRFAATAGIRKLYVSHIYPENDTPDLAQRVARYFDGTIVVAQDLMSITTDG